MAGRGRCRLRRQPCRRPRPHKAGFTRGRPHRQLPLDAVHRQRTSTREGRLIRQVCGMDTSAHGLGNRRDTGIFFADEAATIGWNSDRFRQLNRSGDIVRLARGAYLGSDRWSEADPVRRHVLRTAAHSLALGPSLLGRVALSHDTAAAWWGLPLIGTPSHGHLTRCGPGSGHRRARYSVHEACGSGQYDPLTDSSGCDDPLSNGAGPFTDEWRSRTRSFPDARGGAGAGSLRGLPDLGFRSWSRRARRCPAGKPGDDDLGI